MFRRRWNETTGVRTLQFPIISHSHAYGPFDEPLGNGVHERELQFDELSNPRTELAGCAATEQHEPSLQQRSQWYSKI